MTRLINEKPMNPVLRARLGMAKNAHLRLSALRAALHTMDTISRTATGRPFFGLRESEALMAEIDGLTGPDLVAALLDKRGKTQLVTRGQEHVPATGPAIIAATHPTGMFDYIAHAGALLEKRRDLKVVATAEAKQFLKDDTVVPVEVDKSYRSTSSRATVQAMEAHLHNGGALLVFGSGRVSHKAAGQLVEPDWRGGASLVSQNCNAPLIPAALNARNTDYYYRLRGLAQKLSWDEHVGALFGSVRHLAEFLEKLGGRYELSYGHAMAPGTAPEVLKSAAEGLVPGLYRQA
ncbi:1-acyl-sn-glycerol-3-phosphate acyltransferase [Aestuariivita boseongensis]|uniref:1-acyl-sn-glycerol-3-phosphate acyltransferase n=1 Tax=Aestuariivita boseongensis TaxID=1470562 RepID=UPI0012FCC196|nr:1-acyl-sn-glycerol-3-phosphate acyltransferase [Aestuariivita boseongensis]